jgi:hypothetical protein
MTNSSFTLLLAGAIVTGYCVIGLFFLRFWTKTKDYLFAYFAAAFWLLAAERVVILRLGIAGSHNPMVYLTRLFAFLLIIAAIVRKNRAPRRIAKSPGVADQS